MAIAQSSSVICVSITGPFKSRSPINHRKIDLGIHLPSTRYIRSTGLRRWDKLDKLIAAESGTRWKVSGGPEVGKPEL